MFSLSTFEVVLLFVVAFFSLVNTFLLLAIANSLTRLFDYFKNERFPEEEFLTRKQMDVSLKDLPLGQPDYADDIMLQKTPSSIKIIDTEN